MKSKHKNQTIWHTILTLMILAFAVFFLTKCVRHYLAFPAAVNEYWEAADVQLTQAFMSGDNPYRLESLRTNREVPPVFYQYSFLNSVCCAGLALLLGGRAVLAHYLFALLCMIGSAIFSYLIIDRYSTQSVTPMLGALLTLFCHWRFGYLSTSPISLGIFLSVLTMYLATSEKVKAKALLTAFLCVALFYVKLYFVTIALALFLYYLLTDRLESGKFFGACLFEGAVSVLLIQYFWPLYYTYSLYFINATMMWQAFEALLAKLHITAAAAPVTGMIAGPFVLISQLLPGNVVLPQLAFLRAFDEMTPSEYVWDQYSYILRVFAPMVLALFAGLIVAGRRKAVKQATPATPATDTPTAPSENTTPQQTVTDTANKDAKSDEKTDVKKKDRREGFLPSNDALVLALVQVLVQGICLLYLGREKGAYLSDFLQLLVPSLILAGMICVSKYLQQFRLIGNLAVLIVMILPSIFLGYKKLPLHMITEQEISDWKKAEAYVDEYRLDGEKIYYSPILDYVAIKNGDMAYDNGHTGVMVPGIREVWQADPLAQQIFPYAGEVIDKHLVYQDHLYEDVKNHAYSLITIGEGGFYLYEDYLTECGYKKTDTLPLAVGNATYDIEFWTMPAQ